MAYVRDETLDKFTDEQLLQIVKECLDELNIPYEEGPGDWSGFLGIEPSDFDTEETEEDYTIQSRSSGRGRYRAKRLSVSRHEFDSSALSANPDLNMGQQPEDSLELAAA